MIHKRELDSDQVSDSRWLPRDLQWLHLLVCQKRVAHSKDLNEPREIPKILPSNSAKPNFYVTSELLLFPVAIVLRRPALLLYGMPGHQEEEHREWIVNEVGTMGLTKRPAAAALAAAWRGVQEITPQWPEATKIRFKFDQPIRMLNMGNVKPQDLTLLRDVEMWLNWDYWDGLGLSIKQRAQILTAWGYPSTEKAIKRVKENVLG
jgi:hypothetical protein